MAIFLLITVSCASASAKALIRKEFFELAKFFLKDSTNARPSSSANWLLSLNFIPHLLGGLVAPTALTAFACLCLRIVLPFDASLTDFNRDSANHFTDCMPPCQPGLVSFNINHLTPLLAWSGHLRQYQQKKQGLRAQAHA